VAPNLGRSRNLPALPKRTVDALKCRKCEIKDIFPSFTEGA
jgi:hypothetical protein